MEDKPALSGLPLEELRSLLAPLPSFRAGQVFKWIRRGVSSFDGMTDLSISLREELSSRFSLYSSQVLSQITDRDGTVKLRICLRDNAKIEAVILSDGRGRRTACLSTQAGCPMGCVFCKTGTLGFLRNLDSGEIIEQFLHILKMCPEIDSLVIMGMGEPLLNLEALRKALAFLSGGAGMGFSKRRITVSTCGISGGIRDLASRGPGIRLAVSITTADENLRRRLMPVCASESQEDLKEALLFYQAKTRRRITLEAALLGGINTRSEDAAAMAAFAGGLDAVVNLIPWNPVEGLLFEGRPLRETAAGEAEAFQAELESRGLKVTRRYRKGRGVSGACGQLGEISQKA